jgi:hypothetical protein
MSLYKIFQIENMNHNGGLYFMILSHVLYNDSVKNNRFMLNLKQNIYWTNTDKNQFANIFLIVKP